MDYAVVKAGGKQYRVMLGDLIDVERMPADEGTTIEIGEVLLVSQDGNVTVGSPLVPDARVMGEVQLHGRGKKLVVFRFKAKTRQRKKTGHRQAFTRLLVKDIVLGEVSSTEVVTSPETPRRRRPRAPKKETGDGPKAPSAEVVTSSKTPRRRSPRAPKKEISDGS